MASQNSLPEEYGLLPGDLLSRWVASFVVAPIGLSFKLLIYLAQEIVHSPPQTVSLSLDFLRCVRLLTFRTRSLSRAGARRRRRRAGRPPFSVFVDGEGRLPPSFLPLL